MRLFNFFLENIKKTFFKNAITFIYQSKFIHFKENWIYFTSQDWPSLKPIAFEGYAKNRKKSKILKLFAIIDHVQYPN